jgi:hypothetical protein
MLGTSIYDGRNSTHHFLANRRVHFWILHPGLLHSRQKEPAHHNFIRPNQYLSILFLLSSFFLLVSIYSFSNHAIKKIHASSWPAKLCCDAFASRQGRHCSRLPPLFFVDKKTQQSDPFVRVFCKNHVHPQYTIRLRERDSRTYLLRQAHLLLLHSWKWSPCVCATRVSFSGYTYNKAATSRKNHIPDTKLGTSGLCRVELGLVFQESAIQVLQYTEK